MATSTLKRPVSSSHAFIILWSLADAVVVLPIDNQYSQLFLS